jgi:hypothetical protein
MFPKFSLGRMKVLVFGNSGSGKSTYARALATREGLAHLDLDSIVWEPGEIAVQWPRESVAASLQSFVDSHTAWVIEGCYGELVQAASAHCTLLVFLNPGDGRVPGKQSQAPLGATQVCLARASKHNAQSVSRMGRRVLPAK